MIEDNNDNTSFHDDAPSDQGMNKIIEKIKHKGIQGPKLAKGVVADSETDGDEYSRNLMNEEGDDMDYSDEEDFDQDNDDDYVVRE